MSAIASMLRVMTLRDAEAIVMEAGKVPSMRRRGQLEPMAMPALDAAMLDEFAAPHRAGKQQELAKGPLMMSVTLEGAAYVVTFEKVATGLKLTARKGPPAKPAAATAPAAA